ncbi:MAG: hypothetical protein HY273_04455 [Gammaproteobacteria bacterium]|nr:hypothetical protein [Gammaproteobacteria bacterium]
MNRPLLLNILSSFGDKAFTAVVMLASTVLMVRLLPRSDYGVIGVVMGYGVIIQLFSLSLENAILREHRDYAGNAERFLLNFFVFNAFKALVIITLGFLLAGVLPALYAERGFFWAVCSMSTIVVGDILVGPLVLYASARYEQRLVTMINVARFSLNLILLFGLFYWPSLSYLFVKDVVVTAGFVLAWYGLAGKRLALDFTHVSLRRDVDPAFIWKTLTKYSLWVHMTGVATNFIYRADAFFLSFFAPLAVVGNYNVALTSANVANIAPSILGYQNSVAISHAKDQSEAFRLTDAFLRISTYLGIATLLGFLVLGVFYLQMITGQSNVDDMYLYMVCIVIGLVIAKTIASPLVAYINVKGDVRRLFVRVNLPMLLFASLTYYLSARFFGAPGLAAMNIVNALVWAGLLALEIRRLGYRLPVLLNVAQDVQRLRAYLRATSTPTVPADDVRDK